MTFPLAGALCAFLVIGIPKNLMKRSRAMVASKMASISPLELNGPVLKESLGGQIGHNPIDLCLVFLDD